MATQHVTPKSRQAGFTLIEIMIAMVLTAIAIMGIIALYVTATKASSFSRHSTEATNLAQEKYEMMRTVAPITLNGTGSADGLETTLDAGGQYGSGIYTRVTIEKQYNTAPIVIFEEIQVTVSWLEDGLNRSVVVRGRRGP
ncbi:MAG: prepilin-type N-terminal cleavage/methylation domain-containing protein [Kofleriaceae bacterium]